MGEFRATTATACERCAFERQAELDDDALLAAVERCGACPRLADPTVDCLIERLRRSVGSRRELEVAHRSSASLLQLLSDIASIANATADARTMLGLCLPPLCAAAGFTSGALVTDDRIATHLARDGDPPPAELLAALLASPWSRALARAGAPTWLDDDDLQALAGAAGFRHVLGIPVVLEHAAAAYLLFGEFAERTRELEAIAVAAQLSLATQLRQVVARQQATEASARARELAELANKAKSDFVASISHELRTPLSAILGYGELLAEDLTERGQADTMQVVGRMNGASRHLLGLINNVLDFSKIEAGKMEIICEPVNVDELLDDVVDTLTPMVEDRGNRLLRNGEPIGRSLHTDPTKLRQILFNLIGNAAKFTRLGTITVGAVALAEGDGDTLRFWVEDTGIGMNEAQMARIFEAYTQAEAATALRYGGTGLGLTLCRRFAALLGGTIRVTSSPGVGSRFTVELPCAPAT